MQSDFILKKSPYVITQTLTNKHAAKIPFDDTRIITISLSDNNNVMYHDDTLFYIEVYYYILQANKTGSFEMLSNITLGVHICNESDMPSNPKFFQEMGLGNSLCLDDKFFSVEGYWDEEALSYMEITLFLCQNTSENNNNCKSSEEINDFLSNYKYFQISTYSAQVQFDDYQNPFVIEYPIIYQLVDIQIYKEMSVFFEGIELVNVDGFLFNSQNSINDITIDKTATDYQLIQEGDSAISDILIYASHEKLQNTRRYQTISEVLASLSGTANFFMVFCFFITNLKNYLNTMTTILNDLYTYPDINENQKEKKSVKFNKNKKTRQVVDNDEKLEKEEYIEKPKKFKRINQLDDKSLMNLSKEDMKNFKNDFKTKDNPQFFQLKQDKLPTYLTGCLNSANPSPSFEKDLKGLIPAKQLENDSFTLIHYSQEGIRNNPKNYKNTSDTPNFHFTKYLFPKYLMTHSNHEVDQCINKCSYEKLSIGIFEYVKYWLKKICLLKNSRKEKWIEKSEKILKKELDIISILSQLKEFEKLKLILLNEDQLILFDSLSKPMLNLEENQVFLKYENQPSIKMLNLTKNYQSAKQNKEMLIKSLRNIKKQTKNYEGDINQRLINLFE